MLVESVMYQEILIQRVPAKIGKWEIIHRKSKRCIGMIMESGKRKQYMFVPSISAGFSIGSLEDIVDFIGKRLPMEES